MNIPNEIHEKLVAVSKIENKSVIAILPAGTLTMDDLLEHNFELYEPNDNEPHDFVLPTVQQAMELEMNLVVLDYSRNTM